MEWGENFKFWLVIPKVRKLARITQGKLSSSKTLHASHIILGGYLPPLVVEETDLSRVPRTALA